MSRIHDALLRAEQERALATGAVAASAASVAVARDPEQMVEAAPVIPAEPAPQAAPNELTYELLHARCAQRPWNFVAGRNLAEIEPKSRVLEELRTLRT